MGFAFMQGESKAGASPVVGDSFRLRFHRNDLTGRAFHLEPNRAAADLAILHQFAIAAAGVDENGDRLETVRTCDVVGNFHQEGSGFPVRFIESQPIRSIAVRVFNLMEMLGLTFHGSLFSSSR
jgi:hypothetical protein